MEVTIDTGTIAGRTCTVVGDAAWKDACNSCPFVHGCNLSVWHVGWEGKNSAT